MPGMVIPWLQLDRRAVAGLATADGWNAADPAPHLSFPGAEPAPRGQDQAYQPGGVRMKIVKLVGLLVCAVALSGCLANDTERGLAGAAGGAVIADVTGGNALTGALIGGAAGVFCDDVGVCR
jgi:osmotically inducible lipoprotein OsmB